MELDHCAQVSCLFRLSLLAFLAYCVVPTEPKILRLVNHEWVLEWTPLHIQPKRLPEVQTKNKVIGESYIIKEYMINNL